MKSRINAWFLKNLFSKYQDENTKEKTVLFLIELPSCWEEQGVSKPIIKSVTKYQIVMSTLKKTEVGWRPGEWLGVRFREQGHGKRFPGDPSAWGMLGRKLCLRQLTPSRQGKCECSQTPWGRVLIATPWTAGSQCLVSGEQGEGCSRRERVYSQAWAHPGTWSHGEDLGLYSNCGGKPL